jgi:hypothetical protein
MHWGGFVVMPLSHQMTIHCIVLCRSSLMSDVSLWRWSVSVSPHVLVENRIILLMLSCVRLVGVRVH